uniref:3-hydroxyacyl-CoA dehydrogenase NAD-binding domain-containing protein n=2 Tax=Bacillati TaxID=1783272 RepID=UPI0038B2E5CB
MTELKQITVLGTGVLGSQIAYQAAYHGFDVVAYDINAEVIEKAKARFDSLAAAYKAENVEGAKEGKADEA